MHRQLQLQKPEYPGGAKAPGHLWDLVIHAAASGRRLRVQWPNPSARRAEMVLAVAAASPSVETTLARSLWNGPLELAA